MNKNSNIFQNSILGLQHLLAMYSGAVAVPLLIGTALNFTQEQMTYLISIDIFMCGIATFLQLFKNKYFGIGLPVILGCAVQAVEPLKMIGKNFDINTMYGAIIVAGIFVLLISGVFSKIRILFPSVVTGSLITVIGLTLVPVAIQNIGGGNSNSNNFGNPTNLLLGFITILTIILVQRFAKKFIKSIAVLIGILVGTLSSNIFGMVNLSPISEAKWIHLPQLFYFGTPKFEWSSSLTMIIIAIVSLVESTGVYFAISDLTKTKLSSSDLKRGYRSEGLAQIFGGLFNTFPYTTFSQNIGLMEISGIKSKKPLYFSAGFLVVLGLLPKAGAVATIIPTPVLGGAMLVMFTMISVQGIKMLSKIDFSNDGNLLTVALSIGLGLGVTIYPNIFSQLPTSFQLFFGNGIVIASFTSAILNLIFNGIKKE
ncbi:purine permease [Lactobacillus sp. S2-2]|uniref:nucleobase:cation symporter-2 family protein n=1 Tax=Lactobacillus sp. S2-2 TaxID=2692917 RepID=UPI001F21F7EF|nr:nucleobase:cation symporter-2 family protein [Lactobacillus sp. S2-2]MCF6514758.1 purine permease [Lactobacillus sp. S2-2]